MNQVINEIDEIGEFFFKHFPITQGKTLVTFDRLYSFYKLLKYSLKGKTCFPVEFKPTFSFLEVGVYKGGTSKLALDIIESFEHKDDFRKITMDICDTFSGMPETNKNEDLHKKGDFNDTSLKNVQEYVLGGSPFIEVRFHKGIFPNNFKIDSNIKFDFVHLDVDIYQSYLDSLEYLYEKVNVGGVMLFDDYAFETCPGAKKAVDEFFNDKPEKVIKLNTKQAMIIKL